MPKESLQDSDFGCFPDLYLTFFMHNTWKLFIFVVFYSSQISIIKIYKHYYGVIFWEFEICNKYQYTYQKIFILWGRHYSSRIGRKFQYLYVSYVNLHSQTLLKFLSFYCLFVFLKLSVIIVDNNTMSTVKKLFFCDFCLLLLADDGMLTT